MIKMLLKEAITKTVPLCDMQKHKSQHGTSSVVITMVVSQQLFNVIEGAFERYQDEYPVTTATMASFLLRCLRLGLKSQKVDRYGPVDV